MKTIWKYELEPKDSQKIEMPKGSKVLSVDTQPGKEMENIVLYVIVDSEEKKKEHRRIDIRGTGHNADGCADLQFIGTVKLMGGVLMFHIFDGGVK